MSTLEKLEKWLEDKATELTDSAFEALWAGHSIVYLVYKERVIDVISQDQEIPEGMAVALSLRGNLTRSQMRYRIREQMSKLPILPEVL
jgi:hypothetical protein